jgi:hypothetical protein
MTDQEEMLQRWGVITLIDRTLLKAMFVEFAKIPRPEQLDVLRRAIGLPHERGAALRLLLLRLDSDLIKCLFAELVEAASVRHADVQLCRVVLKSLPHRWVLERIEPVVQKLLDASPEDEEIYSSFAELYDELDDGLLTRLVQIASSSKSDAVREIAADYLRTPTDPSSPA